MHQKNRKDGLHKTQKSCTIRAYKCNQSKTQQALQSDESGKLNRLSNGSKSKDLVTNGLKKYH